MELIKKGKTKDIYKKNENALIFRFKDDATGENGVFDPGSNKVGLSIKGYGNAVLRVTRRYYELLGSMGVPTHYIGADIEKNEMEAVPAVPQ